MQYLCSSYAVPVLMQSYYLLKERKKEILFEDIFERNDRNVIAKTFVERFLTSKHADTFDFYKQDYNVSSSVGTIYRYSLGFKKIQW